MEKEIKRMIRINNKTKMLPQSRSKTKKNEKEIKEG